MSLRSNLFFLEEHLLQWLKTRGGESDDCGKSLLIQQIKQLPVVEFDSAVFSLSVHYSTNQQLSLRDRRIFNLTLVNAPIDVLDLQSVTVDHLQMTFS